MLSRTILYEGHQSLNARMMAFGGWEMPVQYSGIIDEHLAVRKACGLFDISHMGEFEISGEDAGGFVNRVLTNDASRLSVGEGQYSILCNDEGGTIDDLYVFRLATTRYLWVVNATRIASVGSWVDRLRAGSDLTEVEVLDRSAHWSALALQGPRVIEFVNAVVAGPSEGGSAVAAVTDLAKNQIGLFRFGDEPIWVSRTGYTGEDGFELLIDGGHVEALWGQLQSQGHVACLQPVGLGARDTLRTEMGYPLYGHELSESISPLEAGLGCFVKLEKGEFVGRDALLRQQSAGLQRHSIAFRMTGKSPPPRPDYKVWLGDQALGVTTSGSVSPSLKTGIGMALVSVNFPKSGGAFEIEVRGRRYGAISVRKPLYKDAAS